MSISIRTNDRVCIFGRTGSGKTVLELFLLSKLKTNVIVYDIKKALKLPYQKATTPEELQALVGSIHYMPASLEEDDFNDVCEYTYERGNITVIHDECSYSSESFKISRWYKECLVRGRERGVGMINVSQRPMGIHNAIISESNHFFVFQLILDSDVEKLRSVIPREYVERVYTLPEFHYLYADTFRNIKMCAPIVTH